ncbi:hypothetical protein Gasu2_10970 [Galdieria sulphuraria]|nr:hypothetical protein Gasu2_10970 [Galdieria sulphuraria]
MEDSLVFHHEQLADSVLFTNSTAIFILVAFVVSWSADCNQLLQIIGDLSQHCQVRGWKQDYVQFHIFHADNELDKLPNDIPFFPIIFFCLGKIESRVCHKYGAVYSSENLSFLVFSRLIKACPECSIRLESVESSHEAISFLKNRSSRFPYQQVAVMVPSQHKSRIDEYTKLFKQLAEELVYIDFFIFSLANGDNDMVQMIFSDSHFEGEYKSWRSMPLEDAVDLVTWKSTPKFLRWLRTGSPYSPFAPITPETYNNASKDEWFHLVVIPNRNDPQVLDYESLLWELSMEHCLGVSFPEEANENHSRWNSIGSSEQAQMIVIDRQKEVWMRLPLYVLEDVSLINNIYSAMENLGQVSGDATSMSQEYGKEKQTVMRPQITTHSFLYTLQGPAHLEQLRKANTQTVHIVIFYVPWCIFCQQALPAYSYIANHIDQKLLRLD